MSSLQVATVQSPGRLIGPHARVDWLTQAIDSPECAGIDLLIAPELYLTGYHVGSQVHDWAERRDSGVTRRIAELARSRQVAIHVGYAERDGSQLHNSAVCYDRTGVMIAHQRKLLLPPGFEHECFTPGSEYAWFTIEGFTVATLICYDAEFPEAFRQVCLPGCDLVVVPTALGAQWGVVSEHLVPTRAFENGVHVCYANHCGLENGMRYYGGSCIVGPDGQDLARAQQEPSVLTAQLDLSAVSAARRRLPYHTDRLKLPDAGSALDR